MEISALKIKRQNKVKRTNKSKGNFSFSGPIKPPMNLIKEKLYTSEATFKKSCRIQNEEPDTNVFQKV